MTTGASRLMRPGATLQAGSAFTATCQYCQIPSRPEEVLWPAEWWVSPQLAGWPYDGLSRMKGNFHVRFLGGCGRVTARAYPALLL